MRPVHTSCDAPEKTASEEGPDDDPNSPGCPSPNRLEWQLRVTPLPDQGLAGAGQQVRLPGSESLRGDAVIDSPPRGCGSFGELFFKCESSFLSCTFLCTFLTESRLFPIAWEGRHVQVPTDAAKPDLQKHASRIPSKDGGT